MNNKIIYAVAFLGAFLLTTSAVIYLNNNYKDIFRFNFTPVQKEETVNNNSDAATSQSVLELKDFIQNELKNELFDSLRTMYTDRLNDTVYTKVLQDSTLIDSLKNIHQVITNLDQQLAKQETDIKTNQENFNKSKKSSDSAYVAWTKQTAKLYEAMDSKRAAKIIQSYSDNVARDILYSMKQKKAAEIMSELNPETANRITQAKTNAF